MEEGKSRGRHQSVTSAEGGLQQLLAEGETGADEKGGAGGAAGPFGGEWTPGGVGMGGGDGGHFSGSSAMPFELRALEALLATAMSEQRGKLSQLMRKCAGAFAKIGLGRRARALARAAAAQEEMERAMARELAAAGAAEFVGRHQEQGQEDQLG